MLRHVHLTLAAIAALSGPLTPAAAAPRPARPPASPPSPASAAAPAAPIAAPVIVAMVDGRSIALSEVDLIAAADMALVRQFEYDIRLRALDSYIQGVLLEREAKERGLSTDALLAAEVDSRIGEPTPAEIADLWEKAPRFVKQGSTLEASRAGLVAEFRRQRQASLEQEFQKRLRTKHAGVVQVQLQSPRKEVPTEGAPFRGPAEAPVTFVTFTDYQCPGCARADASLRSLEEKNPGLLRIVHHDLPSPHHEGSSRAAEAARCAGEQDLFWPYHDALLSDFTRSTEDGLFATARDVGLDVEAFRSCLDSGRQSAAVASDLALARSLGVSGTPWLFMNGLPLPGVSDPNEIGRVLSTEFSRQRR